LYPTQSCRDYLINFHFIHLAITNVSPLQSKNLFTIAQLDDRREKPKMLRIAVIPGRKHAPTLPEVGAERLVSVDRVDM
jgi:hypothetical protein